MPENGFDFVRLCNTESLHTIGYYFASLLKIVTAVKLFHIYFCPYLNELPEKQNMVFETNILFSCILLLAIDMCRLDMR